VGEGRTFYDQFVCVDGEFFEVGVVLDAGRFFECDGGGGGQGGEEESEGGGGLHCEVGWVVVGCGLSVWCCRYRIAGATSYALRDN